jgi:hypothetical protein
LAGRPLIESNKLDLALLLTSQYMQRRECARRAPGRFARPPSTADPLARPLARPLAGEAQLASGRRSRASSTGRGGGMGGGGESSSSGGGDESSGGGDESSGGGGESSGGDEDALLDGESYGAVVEQSLALARSPGLPFGCSCGCVAAPAEGWSTRRHIAGQATIGRAQTGGTTRGDACCNGGARPGHRYVAEAGMRRAQRYTLAQQ